MFITMSNSQSSELFSVSNHNDFESMDTGSYEYLLTETKKALSKCVQDEAKQVNFYEKFSSLLEDCCLCVNQSLDLINNLLENEVVSTVEIIDYMNNCISILHLLSCFIKKLIQCVSMRCGAMKSFPLTTAQIILSVYTHCKNSETLYGCNLVKVESQLKDIFRSCHELQLTYLMLLDKHFIFDMSQDDEKDIFIQVFNINLTIGELVQSLDVKTMAEQWKGVTLLCEKYAASLVDQHVYDDSSRILCKMIAGNMETALQIYQEEKIIIRSLKVSCFAIKILMKISTILKHVVVRDYRDIVETLCYIYLHNAAFLEMTKRPEHLGNLITMHVINPADALLKELVQEQQFINCVLQYDWKKMKKDDSFYGFVLLLLSIVKLWLQQNKTKLNENDSISMVKMLFSCIPFCQPWFSEQIIKFQLDSRSPETYSFYVYILIHTYSLCLTLNTQQYIELEQIMYESVMSLEHGKALFASHLWIVLSRVTSPQTTVSQVVNLCKFYQKLETLDLFNNSPQEVHLRYVTKHLFKNLKSDNKMAVYREFNINDDKNAIVWNILEVKNLPENISASAGNIVMEKFKMKCRQFFASESCSAEEMTHFIKTMHLTATCNQANDVLDEVIKIWMKVCPETGFICLSRNIDRSNLWYFKFYEALIAVTSSVESCFAYSPEIVKVLHVISSIIETGNIPLSLLSIDIFYNLLKYDTIDEHTDFVNQLFHKTLTCVLSEDVLCAKLIDTIRKDENRQIFLSKIAEIDISTQIVKLLQNFNSEKATLSNPKDFLFKHKCMKNPIIEVSEINKTSSCNFDFDIDDILGGDSSEPQCKKQKTDNDDIECILNKIEREASRLCALDVTEMNDVYKNRIRNICKSLSSLIK